MSRFLSACAVLLVVAVPSSHRVGSLRTYDASANADGFCIRGGGIEVRMRLASLTTGDGTRTFGPAEWRRERDRIEADHGGGIMERYLLEDTRAEQVIVVDRKPDAPGPIEAAIEVGGDADSPAFHYYEAVVLDSAGLRVPIPPHREGGRIVLHVPPHVVACAEFPLLIDPWIQIGGSATGTGVTAFTGGAFGPTLAVDATGTPHMAYYVSSGGNYEIYYKRWDGAAWSELGGSATGGGVSATAGWSYSPSISVDAAGNATIAWYELSGNYEIYLRRWNGSAWVELAGSASGGGVSSNAGASYVPSVAVDGSGNPGVAWYDYTGGNAEIYYRQWNGAAWAELAGSATTGGVSANAGSSISPSVQRLPVTGNPAVGWYDSTGGNNEIYYRQWNGAAWAELGGSATAGGVSATTGSSTSASLAIDATGNPRIAWADTTTSPTQVYYREWNGAAWAELGGSATGSAVSAMSVACSSPSLAMGTPNAPTIAWSATGTGTTEIFLRRWNGTSWAGIGGSEAGGGVSASPSTSIVPSVRIDPAGMIHVGWTDYSGGSGQGYYRRFQDIQSTLLDQRQLDGFTSISVGGSTSETGVVFRIVPIPNMDRSFRLQVDLATTALLLDGTPDAESPLVPQSSAAAVTLPMANGSYHWAARIVDGLGNPLSNWVEFGGNPAGDADLVVSFSGGGSGAVTVIEENEALCGSAVTGRPGAALALLGAIALLGAALTRIGARR